MFHSEEQFRHADWTCGKDVWQPTEASLERCLGFVPLFGALQVCQGKLCCLLCYSPGGLSLETCSESCSDWIEFRNCLCHVGVKGSSKLSLEKPISSQVSLLKCPPLFLADFREWGAKMKKWFSAHMGFEARNYTSLNLQGQKWVLNKFKAHEHKNSDMDRSSVMVKPLKP